MDIAPRWRGLVDVPEEFQELICTVTRHAVADDLARLHVECCEQRGRAMTLVVMGHRVLSQIFPWFAWGRTLDIIMPRAQRTGEMRSGPWC